MKIIAIADLHYGSKSKSTYKLDLKPEQSLDGLTKLLDSYKNNSPDLVVFLGDQIDRDVKEKNLERMETLKQTLNKYDYNYKFLMGNHDNYFNEDYLLKYYGEDVFDGHFIKDNNQFIFLDTIKGRVDDYLLYLSMDQMNWLDKKTKKNVDNTFIFSHAALYDLNENKNPWIKNLKPRLQIEDPKELENLLISKNKNIYLINGHSHLNDEITKENLNYISIDTFCRAINADPKKDLEGQYLEINIDDNNNVNFERKKIN